MEVNRPDRNRGYSLVSKVSLLHVFSFSFCYLAFDFVEEYMYIEHSLGTYVLLLVMVGMTLMLGAVSGDLVSKKL